MALGNAKLLEELGVGCPPRHGRSQSPPRPGRNRDVALLIGSEIAGLVSVDPVMDSTPAALKHCTRRGCASSWPGGDNERIARAVARPARHR